MDTTLVINPGSTSKKYALYRKGTYVLTMRFEVTKEGYGMCLDVDGKRQKVSDTTESEYDHALDALLKVLIDGAHIKTASEITHVGVRVVAPGTFFQKHRVIDDYYIAQLTEKASAAPLHIPAICSEIEKIRSVLPGAKIIGVSDSAFHSTIPPHASTYSIKREDAQTFDIARFGYHGLSMQSVVRKIEHTLGTLPQKMIVCHIGGGVSVAAILNGKSIDTSMGFTPTSGLVMNTRAGDIDPGALLYLLDKKELSIQDAQTYIQHEGGLKGLLGNGDLRVALDRVSKRDPVAEEAVNMFFYHIKKQIGACYAALDGLDTLVLTGTAAERNPDVRMRVCSNLDAVGVLIDEHSNDEVAHREGTISGARSRAHVVALHTDEMGEIARALMGV